MRFEKYYNNIGKVNTWPGPVYSLPPATFDKWNGNKKKGSRPDSPNNPAEIHYHNNLNKLNKILSQSKVQHGVGWYKKSSTDKSRSKFKRRGSLIINFRF